MKKLNFLFLFLMCLFAYQSYEGQNFTVTTCSTGIGSNTYGPMNSITTANSKNRTAFILPASQLTALSGGTLTGTYFRRLATSGSLPAGTNFKIYLKHTTATDFGSSSPDWATEISTATLVYDSDPATAVGSAAGFKQFAHTTNFSYTSGSNLAVYLEYTQTTAPSSSITWDYEYGTTCISTTNSNTTKYLNTSSAFTATLTSTNYRRPVIGFDVTYAAPVSVPACTTISVPAASATNVSITPTFTWASVLGQNGATSYLINLGTSPGATNVMNGVDVGNVTTYTIPVGTPLNFNQQYYLTVIPKNSIGSATGCTERSFTTANISCPSVSAPAAAATGVSTTPTITWTAVTGASGYKLSVGTTAGGTDVLNAQDLGNVTSYTFASPLNAQTKYYYTLNAYQGGISSASCTERNFTTTCNPIVTLPWTENFDSMTTLGSSVIPNCWANTGSWTSAAAAGNSYNDPKSAPNYMTIYYPTTAAYLWTPSFTLTAGQSYDFSFYWVGDGLTGWQNEVLVNNTQSSTGATSLNTFITPTQTATGGSNSTNYTKAKVTFIPTTTGNYTFGVKAFVTTSAPYYFGVDDFNLMLTPSCVEPTALTSSAVTSSTATVSWTAPATAPANGYEYYYSTTNTAPTATTVASGTSATTSISLSALTPATTYYVWVRSLCNATDKSSWSNSVTFMTSCVPVTTLPLVENFDTTPVGGSGNTNAPTCWKYLEPASWAGYGYVSTTYNSSAPNGYYIYNDAATTVGGMLVSPQITPLSNGLNRVRFMAVGSSSYVLQVGTLSNPSDPTTFTQISAITLSGSMAQYTVNIPSGTDQYLAFRHWAGSTYSAIGIDDINIQPIPTCDNPTLITVPSTNSNGASISWTAPASTVGVGYEIYYSTSNTAPNASTVLNATNSVSTTGTATTASITGLTPDTFYYVWVRAKCTTTDSSAWEGATRFYTSNYCTPTTSNQNSWISSFTSTTANTNMAYSSAAANSSTTFGYMNLMSSNKISIAQSSSNTVIPVSITAGGPTVGIAIWVDLNNDNVFGTSEKLYATTSYTTTTSGATLTIPANTAVGAYRMRVLINYNSSVPSDACASFTRGEIIDYSLIVTSTLATNEVKSSKNLITAYPNPFYDVLNISDASNVKNVLVTDISGRLVKTIANPTSELQLGELKQGMYLVTLEMKDGSKQTIKTIKK